MMKRDITSDPARILIVSRHPATVRWLLARINRPVEVMSHLDPAEVGARDHVVGTLPIPLAAAICTRGATLWQLCLDMPKNWRGLELSDRELAGLRPTVRRFDVAALEDPGVWLFSKPSRSDVDDDSESDAASNHEPTSE